MTLTSLSRLMTLRAILIRYFQFSSASSDTARRRNLLNIVLAMTVGLTLAAWGLSALEGDPFSAEYVLMVEAGLLLIGWLNNHRSNPAASLAFLLFLTGLLLTSDSPAEIVHGRTLPAFAVTVVLASVLLRAWAGFVFAGLNAGLVALTAFSVGLPVDAITLVVFIMVAGTTWLGVRMSEQAMAAQRALTQRLAEREAYYRAILENQGEGIGLVDAAERFLYANPAAHVIFGVPAGQLIGRSVLDFLRPTDAPLIQAQTDLRRQGRSSQYELDIQHPNGQSRRLLITATPQYDAAGRFLSTCGVFRDLTERLQLEAELQDSRARYRDLLETVEDWIWEIDLHERYTYASPRVRDMLGYEPAEIVGRTPYDFMATPAEADRVRALIHTWQSGAAALTSVENTCRHRTGRLVVVETSLRPFYNAAGQLRGYRGVDRDVTARKRAEDALRASEARFARAFQTIPDAITIIRQRDMQFLEVNAGFTQLTGFAAGEVRGRSVAEFNLWSRPDTDLAQVRQALRQHGEVKGLELLFRRKDGAERVGLLTVAGLDLEGEASLVGILRDVTDWRQAEQALQKRTEELELLYEAGTRLGSTLDLEAVAEVTHDTIARFMDCPDLYVSRYDPSTQLIHCVHARRFGQRLAAGSFPPIPLEPEGHGTQSIAIRTGETLRLGDYPDYFRTARTRYRISDTGHLQPAQDSDSDEVAASALIVPLKMGGQVHGVIQVFSYTPDAYTLAQQRILEALAPQMAAALANALLYQQAQRELQERQRAETEVRRAYVEKERLVAAIASILIGLDARDQVTQWNAAAETVLGRPAAAALGQPLEALGLNWEWEALREAITACRRTAQPTRVRALQFQPAAGLTRMLGLTVTPLPFEAEPESFGVLILGSDITERLNLERQLVQAQKLESIGQLAAGVAHEINTPTQYVGDNVRFLQDAFAGLSRLMGAFYQTMQAASFQGRLPADFVQAIQRAAEAVDIPYLIREIPAAIQQSLDGLERVTRIVRAMRDFSHPGSEQPVPVDLNRAITSTITVARHEWKYVAEVETDLDPDLPPVPCRPDQLNQALLNILVNAAQAVAEAVGPAGERKGLITVSTRREAGEAVIRVTDTGPGIPEAVRGRVFDPFFTTKPVGAGTGQGLTIAHNVVVHKHGGTLTFETELGVGTTFCLRLPLAPAAEHAPALALSGDRP